jgi:hypothetical protein
MFQRLNYNLFANPTRLPLQMEVDGRWQEHFTRRSEEKKGGASQAKQRLHAETPHSICVAVLLGVAVLVPQRRDLL